MTAFFDTNVLVYAFLDPERRARAIETLAQGGVISAQVLNEFTSVACSKRGRDWAEIDAAVALIRERFPRVMPLTAETNARARRLARDNGLSFYDALIVASALEAGCDTLWTEDMQDGRVFGRLTLRNPFAASAPSRQTPAAVGPSPAAPGRGGSRVLPRQAG